MRTVRTPLSPLRRHARVLLPLLSLAGACTPTPENTDATADAGTANGSSSSSTVRSSSTVASAGSGSLGTSSSGMRSSSGSSSGAVTGSSSVGNSSQAGSGTSHASSLTALSSSTGGSSGAVQQQSNAAFVSQAIPAQVVAGQPFTVTVTMSNTGTTTWAMAAQRGFYLGSESPMDNVTWGTNRGFMDNGINVAPGGQYTFSINLTAPTAAGSHTMQWRMLQDAVEWFGETTPLVTVDVMAGAMLPGRAQVLDYKGHLADLLDSQGRVIWTPSLPGATPEVRADWLQRIAQAGGTHVPIGPFGPGPSYPGVAWDNPDWTQDAVSLRGLVMEILQTPGPNGFGLVPVLFLDSGGRDPRPRLTAFYPVAVLALEGLWDSVLTMPAGWEPVVGDWSSADVSFALETWHTQAPNAIIGYHGSPARLVGSSNPVEVDDPWQGGESAFYLGHGGQFIDIALYQTPHGSSLYDPCDPVADTCWLNRWNDYVVRIGGGLNGWRVMPLVLYETCAYEFFRGQVTHQQCRDVATRGKSICDAAGVTCGYGNGLPQ